MEIHRLTEIDKAARRGVCCICGPVKIKVFPHNNGAQCWTKFRANLNRSRNKVLVGEGEVLKGGKRVKAWKYRKHVKPVCDRCGFEATHPSLIDGHHKDGNRKNNSPENIESLCPICHRIEHLPVEVREGLFGEVRLRPNPRLCVVQVAASVDKQRELELEALRRKIREYEVMLNGS